MGASGMADVELESLEPRYIERQHRIYVDRLKEALRKGLKNIAVAGVYGSGKSSVINEAIREYDHGHTETVMISLAPVASSSKSRRKSDNLNFPQQAGVEEEQDTNSSNLIQREIVKQLLYSVNPKSVPRSHFKRLTRPSHIYNLLLSVLLSVVLVGCTSPMSFYQNIARAFSIPLNCFYTFSALVMSVLLFVLCYWLDGKVSFEQLKAGPATVKLDRGVDTYFDQYLDEIVYLLDSTGKRIVVFEDLDRFNESKIFDELRDLNILLNNTKIDSCKKPVQFIYAIRDGIFQSDNTSKVQIGDAYSRTKFFDCIIPIVPFISHENASRNAREVFSGLDFGEKAYEVLDIASRYVTDMRTLKSIRNDCLVYSEKLEIASKNGLGLDCAHLLAFLFYKNIYYSDAEKIFIGKSAIDDVYQRSREIAANSIEVLRKEQLNARQQLALSYSETEQERVTQLSGKLKPLLVKLVYGSQVSVNDVDIEYEKNSIEEKSFWSGLASLKEGESARILISDPRYPRESRQLFVTKEQLQSFFGVSPDVELWPAETSKELRERIEGNDKRIRELRGADMGYFFEHSNYGLPSVEDDSKNVSLGKYFADRYGEWQLLRALLESGWLNRDYILYASVFNSTGTTANAINFVYHVLEQNAPDYDFPLSADDARAVLGSSKNLGSSVFSEKCSLNYDLLDYLLKNSGKSSLSELYTRQMNLLSQLEDRDVKEFVQRYIVQGRERDLLISQLAPRSEEALSAIATCPMDTQNLLECLNVAFDDLSLEQQYEVDDQLFLGALLSKHWRELRVLTSEDIAPERAEMIADIFVRAHVIIDSLADLKKTQRAVFVEHRLYELSRKNILCALGLENRETLPALSMIKTQSSDVYEYLINSLDSYLDLLEDNECALDVGDSGLLHILEDIKENNDLNDEEQGALFDRVLAKASSDTRIQILDENCNDFLPFLLKADIVVCSLENVAFAFASANNSIDLTLANYLLKHQDIEQSDSIAEDTKDSIALAIVNIKSADMPIAHKISLINSMKLRNSLDASEINLDSLEEGSSFALLMSEGIIEDSVVSFGAISQESWNYKKSYILSSQNFASYVGAAGLSPEDACSILSEDAPQIRNVQKAIEKAQVNYLEGANHSDLLRAVNAMAERNVEVSIDVLDFLSEQLLAVEDFQKLKQSGLPHAGLIHLLASTLKDDSQVSDVLRILNVIQDAQFETLLDRGNKSKVDVENTDDNKVILEFFAAGHVDDKALLELLEGNGSDGIVHAKKLNLSIWHKLLKELSDSADAEA